MYLDENDTTPDVGHDRLKWPKVRKRAILQKTTEDDWENADQWQRQVMHQIELAILSVTKDDNGDS
jgi:hypothetical protein